MPAEGTIEEQTGPQLDRGQKWLVALACLASGFGALAGKWLPGIGPKILYGLAVTALFAALSVLAHRSATLRDYWELPFAFFVFAFVQLLNNSIPHYVGVSMHDRPTTHNSLAGTVHGSVIVQLLDTAIAIIPIVVFTKMAGFDLGSIYVRVGKLGKRFFIGVGAFALFYLVSLRGAHRIIPTHGTISPQRFLTLTPALLALVISNGFQEELLFRGLFLLRFQKVFGVRTGNAVQAGIFALAHIGVTYTPSDLVFIVVFVFPIGLFAGYLMRTTESVIAPAFFHAGADIPIYLAYLSYVV